MDILLYNVDDEIKPMIFDILRLVTMQVVTQLLVSVNTPKKILHNGIYTSNIIFNSFIDGFLDGRI